MFGSSPVIIAVGSTYVDAGAIAFDNIDGVLTSAIVTVNSVDTTVIGNYKVTYNVVDAAGNKAVEVVRTVNVFAPTVIFVVTDGKTGRPIYDAKVSLERNSIMTNKKGRAFFFEVIPRDYIYTVSKDKYLKVIRKITVSGAQPVNVVNVELSREKPKRQG